MIKKNTRVVKNRFGYFELAVKPTQQELDSYYNNQYYQQTKGAYQKDYSKEEKEYFNFKIEQIYQILKQINQAGKAGKFLDIGCGEGWALNFFWKKKWQVTGLEYNRYSCKKFNPQCLKTLKTGDINRNIEKLKASGVRFDLIWLNYVLEHVLDPLALLSQCSQLLTKNGILVVKVPNDFSQLQNMLLKEGYVDRMYWISVPDHISYFNRGGLVKLCEVASLKPVRVISDFPIDFNLLNKESNYILNPDKGKSCHQSRVRLEKFIHSVSIEKTNQLYELLADMGLGREIIGIFIKK
ncbi:MAG: class I SAM-dependent methyltransferase [bacterium]